MLFCIAMFEATHNFVVSNDAETKRIMLTQIDAKIGNHLWMVAQKERDGIGVNQGRLHHGVSAEKLTGVVVGFPQAAQKILIRALLASYRPTP